MVTLGLDPHPASHTVVALDRIGSLLGSITVPNTATGLEELHGFASQFASRRWAIEGAGNHFISQFVMELLANGEAVYPTAPSLTSQYRCRRGRKKNDEVDAANVITTPPFRARSTPEHGALHGQPPIGCTLLFQDPPPGRFGEAVGRRCSHAVGSRSAIIYLLLQNRVTARGFRDAPSSRSTLTVSRRC